MAGDLSEPHVCVVLDDGGCDIGGLHPDPADGVANRFWEPVGRNSHGGPRRSATLYSFDFVRCLENAAGSKLVLDGPSEAPVAEPRDVVSRVVWILSQLQQDVPVSVPEVVVVNV
jgi:hypothetical protein